jgi:hypothetical protein
MKPGDASRKFGRPVIFRAPVIHPQKCPRISPGAVLAVSTKEPLKNAVLLWSAGIKEPPKSFSFSFSYSFSFLFPLYSFSLSLSFSPPIPDERERERIKRKEKENE